MKSKRMRSQRPKRKRTVMPMPIQQCGEILYNWMKKVVIVVSSRPIIRRLSSSEEDGSEYGVGVVINRYGYILTCTHLVPEGNVATIHRREDKAFQEAEVFLRAPQYDLAILKTKNIDTRLLHSYEF
ncbi:hypothetical protein LOK49_LG12G02470 [Camellia lanceoleosa]|uniref:Uncharacterized protein n=1 Tax=Camellia lanceoleosa TaxID=1840588 RepID=A0ACC0FYB2_9ERIC|nr:hypothetical protein LOK49_LG12G02470 [Camellia lanceoleosa]